MAVTIKPRLWSSYVSLPTYYSTCDNGYPPAAMTTTTMMMNNGMDETYVFKDTVDDLYHPPAMLNHRRVHGYSYDLPLEKQAKKEKKWSLSSLFRRKKDRNVHSSSDEDQHQQHKHGFLSRRRRKNDEKRKKSSMVGFDHVVVLPKSKTYVREDDMGVLSDPSYGFNSYNNHRTEDHRTQSVAGSADNLNKKNRKVTVKARALARRQTLHSNHCTSSEDDDGSQKSLRIMRSDESLAVNNKRSRSARTERYLKRHSRDGENPFNYLRLSKSDADAFRPSNNSSYPVSNSTSNPSYKPPQSMNDYLNTSFDNNINNVQHVQFPVLSKQQRRNYSLIDATQVILARQPPQPPPRDPSRMINNHFESRPNTCYYYLENPSNNTNNFRPTYRSTSEIHLTQPAMQTITRRPNSTTPEPRNRYQNHTEFYNYLTDKKPRSRKPIFIQPNNPIHSVKEPNKSVKPQMFTSQTRVQTQVYVPHPNGNVSPFKPVSPTMNEVELFNNKSVQRNLDREEVKRKSANLEEALDELEAIYNSLRLGDEDLLERAEQREKESVQKQRSGSRGALSDSSFSYEPFDGARRIKTPRKDSDDMYKRKLRSKEKSATISDPQSVLANVSYLLASPLHMEYEDPGVKSTSKSKEPDITLDDVVYRNVKHANSTLKTPEPQPPFGIPLGPVTPASNSDYLHAVPDSPSPVIYKPRKIPDIVKDDLAYRNLRKDPIKDSILPPQHLLQQDASYKKKQRAVRSLSANIGSLMTNTRQQKSDDVVNEFKTLTDIADAMEIARKVLQEKGKTINETRKAFMSDSDAHYDSFKDRRQKFLNSLKTRAASPTNKVVAYKPPTPDRKVKELTPIPKSQLEEEEDKSNSSNNNNSSLDDLLNALAEEAKQTTERISKELEMMSEEKLKSDSLNKRIIKVESQNIEETVDNVHIIKPDVKEETANIVVITCGNDDINTKDIVEIESDHDYENLVSDKELNVDEMDIDTKLCDNDLNIPKNQDVNDGNIESREEGLCCNNTYDCVMQNANSSLSALLSPDDMLKSPRLVLEASTTSLSAIIDHNDAENKTDKSQDAWYLDAENVILACSYGIACIHHLVCLDLVAAIGIVLAVLSFVTALMF